MDTEATGVMDIMEDVAIRAVEAETRVGVVVVVTDTLDTTGELVTATWVLVTAT